MLRSSAPTASRRTVLGSICWNLQREFGEGEFGEDLGRSWCWKDPVEGLQFFESALLDTSELRVANLICRLFSAWRFELLCLRGTNLGFRAQFRDRLGVAAKRVCGFCVDCWVRSHGGRKRQILV